jgi:hypothetical protein
MPHGTDIDSYVHNVVTAATCLIYLTQLDSFNSFLIVTSLIHHAITLVAAISIFRFHVN